MWVMTTYKFWDPFVFTMSEAIGISCLLNRLTMACINAA